MSKIVVLTDIPQYENAIREIAPGWEIIFTKNKEMAREHLPGAEIVVGWSSLVKDLCLNEGTSLKWVQGTMAGVDNLPLELLAKRGVTLTNARGVHPKQLSESIFAAMLALARNIPTAVKAQEQCKWEHDKLFDMPSDEIHGKTLGILGVGAIGEEVAKIARGFSMYSIGMRRSEGIVPYINDIYTQDRLHEMLGRCDYVVNLLPLTEDTKGIIDEDAFNAMRDGARYFAFGRGETTSTPAMIKALESGKLAAAGLDVFSEEPLPADSPLWKMENVLIMPHYAGTSPYYMDRLMEIFLANLKSYVAGDPIEVSKVNLGLGY